MNVYINIWKRTNPLVWSAPLVQSESSKPVLNVLYSIVSWLLFNVNCNVMFNTTLHLPNRCCGTTTTTTTTGLFLFISLLGNDVIPLMMIQPSLFRLTWTNLWADVSMYWALNFEKISNTNPRCFGTASCT